MKYRLKLSCGHEQVVDIFGNQGQREKKIAYMQENMLCRECFAQALEESRIREGVRFFYYLLPVPNPSDGELMVTVWISGVGSIQKEDLLANGYRNGSPLMRGEYDKSDSPCMTKDVRYMYLEREKEFARNMGAKIQDVCERSIHLNMRRALERKKLWEDYYHKPMMKLIPPIEPDLLTGKKWNGKIYGKIRKSIYLDGVETPIDEETEAELTSYLELQEIYKDEVKSIKENYMLLLKTAERSE